MNINNLSMIELGEVKKELDAAVRQTLSRKVRLISNTLYDL